MSRWFLHAGSDVLLKIKLFLCTLMFESAVVSFRLFLLALLRRKLCNTVGDRTEHSSSESDGLRGWGGGVREGNLTPPLEQ